VAKELSDLKRLRKMAFMGAMVTESASIIPIAGSHVDVAGKIPGFVGIGVAGTTAGIFDKRKRKRKKKKRR